MYNSKEQLEKKISQAKAVMESTLKQFNRPCVLWSGGKDSMVLLHLLMAVTKDALDVVCWREPWQPWRQKFVNRMIAEWNLVVWDYAPSRVELCKGNGRIDVLNYYQTGPNAAPDYLILARGTEEPDGKQPWLCGVDTFLARPVGSFNFNWDVMFHGHKSCDVDPTSGAVPLKLDLIYRPNQGSQSYPLREFTDEDIFDYIELMDVPYDKTRYRQLGEGGWEIVKEKTFNPDYYPTCMRCVDPDAGEFVDCPKLNLKINNISSAVKYSAPSASYCSLRQPENV